MSKRKPNYEVIKKHLFDSIHSTGQDAKNHFPHNLWAAITTEAWKQFKTAEGKSFKNLGEWLVYSFPFGCHMGHDDNSFSYEDALHLCSGPEHKKLHGLLVKHRPKGTPGRKAESNSVDNINGLASLPKRAGGTSRRYIEQKLQQGFPAIYKDYVEGRIKSARQAGIKAGFVKDTHCPLMRLKADWKRANKKQRAEFLKWKRTKEAR